MIETKRMTGLILLSMTATLAPATVPERSTIDQRYTWDLSKMYAARGVKPSGQCGQLDSLKPGARLESGAMVK